jgi:hypothetical protein
MLIAFSHGPERNVDLIPKEYTWEQLAQRMAQVKPGPKAGAYLIRGGNLIELKRDNDNLLEAELLVIDGDSSFDPETGEVFTGIDPDEPDPDRRVKGNCVPIEQARDALDRLGYRYIIHTTHTNTPGILNKWRAYLPAKMKSKAELEATIVYVIAQLHAEGCYVEPNGESKVWAQPWYLPRSKPKYMDAYQCFASLSGKDVDVQAAVSLAKREQAAEEAIRAAKPEKPKVADGDSIIKEFNRASSLDWVRNTLAYMGYKFVKRQGDEFRYMSPTSTTGMAGVKVFKGAEGDWCCYSHHGAHDPLSHRLTDPARLYAIAHHGGDLSKACSVLRREKNQNAQEGSDPFEGIKVNAEDFNKAGGEEAPAGEIKTLTFMDLMNDNTPDEPDYISPDFLGPGNFCLIAGPPKAQKSFLLTEMLVACATGGRFLGGTFHAASPLKVFYLQAEMGKKLLKRRAKMMQFLTPEEQDLLQQNLVVTERLTMQLTKEGVQKVIKAIKARFPEGPDIIAIDPLANLFDGESEDKAPEMLRFLNVRLQQIRQGVNPNAAIILVHHSGKKSLDEMERDPFSAIRGSSAIRGHYDTGIMIYRRSDDDADRRVHFELRNGESPPPMTVKLNAMARLAPVDTSSEGITRSVAKAMLAEIDTRWKQGNPLSLVVSTRNEGRFAPMVLSRAHGLRADQVTNIIQQWMMNGVCEVAVRDTHTKKKGIKKLQNLE